MKTIRIAGAAIIGIAVVIALAIGYHYISQDKPIAHPQRTDVVITANPVDLNTIQGVTKFRSCFGHEFGFTSAFEGKEAKSSLKHYFVWKSEYQDQDHTIPIYAAFDGEILIWEEENDQFLIEQRPFLGWVITYTHIVLQPGLDVGSQVKAGDLIAYAQTINTHAFDIALQANETMGEQNNYDWYNKYDSIFNHMTETVYTQFASKGFTTENMIITKAIRDASPCPCDPSNPPIASSPYCNFPPIPYTEGDNGVEVN